MRRRICWMLVALIGLIPIARFLFDFFFQDGEGKIQSLVLAQSPFDRHHGMATLLMDTVGASPFEPPLRIRYLPEAEARALHDRLAANLGGAPIRARTAA